MTRHRRSRPLHWYVFPYRLVEEIKREPFTGIGKPEPLKGQLSGWCSRRIDEEHRLVYRVRDDTAEVVQARGRYDG